MDPTANETRHCDVPAKGEPHTSMQFHQCAKRDNHWARVSEVTVRAAGE